MSETKKILVTGSAGFIGKNFVTELKRLGEYQIFEYDVHSTESELDNYLKEADIIFHLAGINRPKNEGEFKTGNTDFTLSVCDKLISFKKQTKIVMSSSIQAELDNPYGLSKKQAENALREYSEKNCADAVVYRLANVFGKWCKPNYNSAVATFCYNISHNQPITISDPANIVNLVYIDDVIKAFINEIDCCDNQTFKYSEIKENYKKTLGELVDLIKSFKSLRNDLILPDFDDTFIVKLYATYLSYLDKDDFAYNLKINSDNRGSLAEFIKSPSVGQIFVSRTLPGITRGNHWHHTKVEKFLVIEGQGIIKFRHILNNDIIEYKVDGAEYRVVDIPPGYTHSIENIGNSVLVTLFWASEIFNSEKPDTFFENV